MCTHNLCFEQKYENSLKNSTENCHFYSREKSLYITWACFRNVIRAILFALIWGLKPQSHIHDFGPGRATVHPDLASL